jgi:hypothetical protein
MLDFRFFSSPSTATPFLYGKQMKIGFQFSHLEIHSSGYLPDD